MGRLAAATIAGLPMVPKPTGTHSGAATNAKYVRKKRISSAFMRQAVNRVVADVVAAGNLPRGRAVLLAAKNLSDLMRRELQLASSLPKPPPAHGLLR
jgi:hypothetical protein